MNREKREVSEVEQGLLRWERLRGYCAVEKVRYVVMV